MSHHLSDSYDPNNISKWIEYQPYDFLAHSISDARVVMELLYMIGLNLVDTESTLSSSEMVFEAEPSITFNVLTAKLKRHVMAFRYLVAIGYHYRQPEEQRYWESPEDFDFEITFTDNFDAPVYGQTHRHIPPLSMLYAISKSFVEHGTEADYYFRLLEEPEARRRVYFKRSNTNKTHPLSLFKGGLLDHTVMITRMGQTGINYVNAKRKEIKD